MNIALHPFDVGIMEIGALWSEARPRASRTSGVWLPANSGE